MQVSPVEREELIRRVTRRMGRAAARAEVVGVVDRVLAALATAAGASGAGDQVVVVTGESMPDLASRLRRAVDRGVSLDGLAVATEGRHTVCVARVDGAQVPAVRAAAEKIGARMAARDRG